MLRLGFIRLVIGKLLWGPSASTVRPILILGPLSVFLGLQMLYLSDIDPVGEEQCGWVSHGFACSPVWTKNVTLHTGALE